MHCTHCARAVEDILKKNDGISTFVVDLGSAEITTSDAWEGEVELIEALEIEGFRVTDVAIGT